MGGPEIDHHLHGHLIYDSAVAKNVLANQLGLAVMDIHVREKSILSPLYAINETNSSWILDLVMIGNHKVLQANTAEYLHDFG